MNDTVEFAKNLKFGWNLGNTLDATGSTSVLSETSWGQPKATKELMDYLKEAGFTTVRIPVSWGNHTSTNDYVIDEKWMARVTEVVDYALDAGLYVILNAHHDCDYYYPSDAKLESSIHYLECIWPQIADNFKDYDERLIFESMNEPRLKDTSKEWWFDKSDSEGVASIKCINKLNQVFVDIIRSYDGQNNDRYLMVPSYAANPDFALNDAFEAPVDPSGKVMISVHAYTPYDFAMNPNGYTEWDKSKEFEFGFMERLNKKFIQNGYGVVIGEFGVTNKNNQSDRLAWAEGYTRKASEKGIPCIVWDNGATGIGEENFGLIDRKNLKSFFPDLLEEYLQYYK